MLAFPVFTRGIEVLRYDISNKVLWARTRDGRFRAIPDIQATAVLRMVCQLPVDRSDFLRGGNEVR